MLNHDLFPVFCVSALNDMGSGRLMGFIDNVAPAAADLKPEQISEGKLSSGKKKRQRPFLCLKPYINPIWVS